MLQVGGRLKNSSLPFENQYQIILLSRHHLAEYTVKADHQILQFVGPQYLLASLRMEISFSRGRQLQQSIPDKHSPCFKQWAVASKQLMYQLLTPRVQLERPFLKCGVDYAWPLYVKDSQGAKFKWNAMSPYWIAAVKIVHLNWSSISWQILLLLQFKGLLHKWTSNKIFILTMGQFYWSSSWTLRIQEACRIGSAISVKISGICKSRSI